MLSKLYMTNNSKCCSLPNQLSMCNSTMRHSKNHKIKIPFYCHPNLPPLMHIHTHIVCPKMKNQCSFTFNFYFISIYWLPMTLFYNKKRETWVCKVGKNFSSFSFHFALAYKWFLFSITFSTAASFAICCTHELRQRCALMLSIFHPSFLFVKLCRGREMGTRSVITDVLQH